LDEELTLLLVNKVLFYCLIEAAAVSLTRAQSLERNDMPTLTARKKKKLDGEIDGCACVRLRLLMVRWTSLF